MAEITIPILDDDETAGAASATSGAALPVLDENRAIDEEDELPEHAVLLPNGSIRLPLVFPVKLKFQVHGTNEVREESYAELVMSRLTGADVIAITSTDKKSLVCFGIGRSARMHQGKMKLLYAKMDARDTTFAARVFSHFFGNGRRMTGI